MKKMAAKTDPLVYNMILDLPNNYMQYMLL